VPDKAGGFLGCRATSSPEEVGGAPREEPCASTAAETCSEPAPPMWDLLPLPQSSVRTVTVLEDESVALEKVLMVTEDAAGRQEGAECKPGNEPLASWRTVPQPAVPESSSEQVTMATEAAVRAQAQGTQGSVRLLNSYGRQPALWKETVSQ
jgi:hypothetical protein